MRRFMKNILIFVTGLFVLAILFPVSAIASPTRPTHLVMCSAPAGGTSFYLATGLTRIVTTHTGFIMTNEATSGSGPENAHHVSDRPYDTFGMLNTDTMNSALLGLPDRGFRRPFADIRLVMVGHMQYLYAIVMDGSDIQSFADLRGRRIALPPRGQGAYYQMRIILEAHGLQDGDFRAVAMTNAEAGDALRDGTVDVAVVSGSIPQVTASDLNVTHNIRFLSLEQEIADRIIEQYPQYGLGTIPADAYNMAGDTLTLTLNIVIVADARMDDQVVYEVVRAIAENYEEMREIHVMGVEYGPNSSRYLWETRALPFHNGALRFFDELWGSPEAGS
jgi:TRAP transporter TAXI family solute receptor